MPPGVVTISTAELQRLVTGASLNPPAGVIMNAPPAAAPRRGGPFETFAALGELLQDLDRDQQVRVLKTAAMLLGIDVELYTALGGK